MPDYDGAYGRLTAWLLQSYEDRHIEVEHGATEEWLEEPTDHFEENVGWVIDSPGVRMQSVTVRAYDASPGLMEEVGRDCWTHAEVCVTGTGSSLDEAAQVVLNHIERILWSEIEYKGKETT
jgi:hypothetical protein